MLATAEKVAGWVSANLPATFVPLFDYAAPAGAPTDTSARVITAAGLLRLGDLCRRWGACSSPAERWSTLGRNMLAGAMGYVSRPCPLGFFGGAVGTFGGLGLGRRVRRAVLLAPLRLEAIVRSGASARRADRRRAP